MCVCTCANVVIGYGCVCNAVCVCIGACACNAVSVCMSAYACAVCGCGCRV